MSFWRILGGIFAANVALDQLSAIEQERQERRTAAWNAECDRQLADLRRHEREQQEAMESARAWSERMQREQDASDQRLQDEIGRSS